MGHVTMDHSTGVINTNLVDLNEVHFAQLRDLDESVLKPSAEWLLPQIERPRANIGGTGPPGRVD